MAKLLIFGKIINFMFLEPSLFNPKLKKANERLKRLGFYLVYNKA